MLLSTQFPCVSHRFKLVATIIETNLRAEKGKQFGSRSSMHSIMRCRASIGTVLTLHIHSKSFFLSKHKRNFNHVVRHKYTWSSRFGVCSSHLYMSPAGLLPDHQPTEADAFIVHPATITIDPLSLMMSLGEAE